MELNFNFFIFVHIIKIEKLNVNIGTLLKQYCLYSLTIKFLCLTCGMFILQLLFLLIDRPHLFYNTNLQFNFFFFQKDFDFWLFKVVGCECFPFICPYQCHEFSYHFENYVFLGYSSRYKKYKCKSLTTKHDIYCPKCEL